MSGDEEIDDSLYSRQRYVLGDGAMHRMAHASVLLYGVGGLGIEIAKNLVLAGVKSFTIQDPESASVTDLATQFFLRDDDVQQKRNRAEASAVHLAELNPYVSIKTLTTALDHTTDLKYMEEFQCIILTDVPFSTQLLVNEFCRANKKQFISASVLGLFSMAFCDFGEDFEVADPNGEEPKDVFVASITKANPGVVTSLDNKMHGFETDDTITFKEVNGMMALNGKRCTIKVMSPYAFSICDTSGDEFEEYENGGIATQVKLGRTVNHESLETQLGKPDILMADFSKFEVPLSVHAAVVSLSRFVVKNGRMPNAWCETDAKEMREIVNSAKDRIDNSESISDDIVNLFSYTCRGCFLPLCAAMGGIVAQEGLKAITGKFTPLNQWLYLDAIDCLNTEDSKQKELFQARGDRYDAFRICVGDTCLQKLQKLKLFMVGCGAIGCEMLKNYALLGVGTCDQGHVTITDNDLIEKSNLNRQFLFRPKHIRQPKSSTAAQSVLQINPGMKITAQQHKVCPQTEDKVYPDSFFEAQDLIVNALDNVEARRYVDSRCVTAQRSLLESGTLGTKGHTQVIVAHVTESYSSQRDPPEEDVPYCTLKSFPANIEHCIQWARDKFESSFTQKPNLFNKFWTSNPDIDSVIQHLTNGDSVEGAVQTGKLVETRPQTWADCIRIGRLKFEKYFNHRAKTLLHVFPMDTKLSDGTPFWQSPKRPPVPVVFNADDPLHYQFVVATAHLFADNNRIAMPEEICPMDTKIVLQSMKVPEFVPRNKTIETDEGAGRKAEEKPVNTDELQVAAQAFQKAVAETNKAAVLQSRVPADFEKDDDSNGHIDFISSAANLRACMYQIETADRLRIKRIAGRIVPAIATTTAAVSGLITSELIKVAQGLPIEKYRNTFLNLALPVFLMSEPGPAEKTLIREDLTFTNWDRWEVQGSPSYTLQDFLNHFKTTYGYDVTMVGHGVKMVYVPFMPGHVKRLPQTMVKLLKPGPSMKYLDLVISMESIDDDDIPGPPIRYFFNL